MCQTKANVWKWNDNQLEIILKKYMRQATGNRASEIDDWSENLHVKFQSITRFRYRNAHESLNTRVLIKWYY